MSAKIMLMDTILKNIPMPKFYVQSEIRTQDTYRSVIDGQQRISSILEFLNDGFKLYSPYADEHIGMKFSELPNNVQDRFLAYELNFNEIKNATEDVVREIYSRVNRYSVALNKQELRRADYPGHFLKVSEKLAQRELLDTFNIFTIANRRRMQDVEYTSELLVALIDGSQDKKLSLDTYYENLRVWDETERHAIVAQFDSVLAELNIIFSNSPIPISKTRFRQKADFYALFLAISELLQEGGSIEGKNITPLIDDLLMLNTFIEPSSSTKVFSEYAIKCTSQANTHASRKWRKNFLKRFLFGSYISEYPSRETVDFFHSIIEDEDDSMCPAAEHECSYCNKSLTSDDDFTLEWNKSENVFQLGNAYMVHRECSKHEYPNPNQQKLF